jgi:hypothetical protein
MNMKSNSMFTSLLTALLAATGSLGAQAPASPSLRPAIEDNSFFVEEAYNQERGVVQHVFTFARFGAPRRVTDGSFTQEWPLGSQAHQLSLTLPYSWSAGAGASGFGDVLVNYRYQLAGHAGWAALAPRLSLVLPTGSGANDPGLQLNLPASKRLGARLVAHANAGATFLPGAGQDRLVNVGGSVVGLATPKLNLLVELAWTCAGTRDAPGRRAWEREVVVSPGVRAAIDVGGLQIVPGLALPVRRSGGRRDVGVFAYLSLEHPFGRAR